MNSRLLAALVTLVTAIAASAQPAPKFEDSMAQRTLACTTCHGTLGRAGPDGYYPRLAGKPAGYLYNQLLNFREGRRHYGLMTRMVDPLGDAYLMEIAQYFSALDMPYPAPSPASGVAPELLSRGRTLALQGDSSRQLPACVQCHGAALTGVVPNIPGLLGLPRDYLNAQLGGWQTRQRRAHAPDCMASIAQRLQPQDLSAVAAWLSTQPVPANGHPVLARPTPASLPSVTFLDLPCGSAPLPAGATP